MKKQYNDDNIELSQEDANRILSNIFTQVKYEPNTVPLSVLESYSNYRVERFALQRFILAFFMTLFVLLPLMFLTPKMTVTPEEGKIGSYILNVDSIVPIRSITAKIGQRGMPISEIDPHQFLIQPLENGDMEIIIRLVNRQSVSQTITVDNVDTQAPTLVGSDYDNTILNLYFQDDFSGVCYEKITAANLSGEKILPLSTDKASGRVTFPYPTDTLNVFIPDEAENTLHLVISLR